MRIILIGQAAFGAQVLERLAQRGDKVVGAFAPVGRRGDPLKEVAGKLNIPIYQITSMKDPEVFHHYSRLNPDLGIMAFVTDIVPVSILGVPKLGTIQYHPSLLPKHRGGSAINWAIVNGETKTGITIFWPDEGIDTGPILMQKEISISNNDTVGSLYFNKLYPAGIESLLEAVNLIKQGVAPQIPQDESQATYEGLCGESEARIDWSQPSKKTYNLIRGTNPQPGAYTFLHGKQIKIFDSELSIDLGSGKPGQILDISEAGIKIAAIDGAIQVKRVQPEAMAKMGSTEYAKLEHLKIGTIFEGYTKEIES